MSGKRYFLDTNAIVSLLRGDARIALKLSDAEWIGISIISVIEYLSYNKLEEADKYLMNSFMEKVDVINLEMSNDRLIDTAVSVRKKGRIKLPDAIIVACALLHNAIFVTADKELFKIEGLSLLRI